MKNRNLTQNYKCRLFKIVVLSALTFCSPLIIWGSNTVNKISEKDILQSTITASGIVQDIKGNPIIGASIVITGTGKGVVTDMNGHFTITTNDDCILRISSIGYIGFAE